MLKNIIMGDYVVPISFIDSISITESIYSPICNGLIICSDSGFVDKVSKFKDFNLNLVFADNDTDNEYLISFLIHGFDDTEYDTRNQIINKKVLKFSSFYSIQLLTSDYYLNFQNKNSFQMIKSISDILKVKFNYKNDNISYKWDYVSPNWTLNKSIDYILQRTIDNDNHGGFLFFPDMFGCRVNFMNYYDILSGKIGFYKKPLVYDSINDSYLGNIISFNIIKEYNLIRELKKGLTYTNTISFDTTVKNNIVNDKNTISSTIKNNDKLYGYLPISKEDISDGLNVDVFCHNSETVIKAIKSQKYNDMLMNQIAVEILCNGDYNRKLGMIIPVVVTKYASNDETNTKKIDDKISGSYILSDIEHFWTNNYYQQKIKCIKSGYSDIIDNKNLFKIK